MQQVTYDWRKDAAHGERLKGWVRTLSCLLCAACGLGLFFHLGSGGGSFIAAMLAFIVPCMGYKAVNNHSAKHLGWFNCLNICCAVVAAITMVGVLLIGIPIAECACHEECLVNMIDGFEEAANMTSGAEYQYGPQPLDHFEHDSQGPVLAFPGDEGEGVPESGAPRPSGAHAHHDGPPPPPPAPGAMHPQPQPQPHPEASRRMSRIGRLLAMVGMGAPHPHPHPHGHRMHPHAHRPHHPHHRLGGHRRRAQEHHDRDHEHVHEHKQGEGEDGSHRGHKFMRAVKGAIRAVWVAFDHHVHGGEHEHEEAPVADYGEPVTMPTEPVTTLPFQLDGQPEPDTADEHRGHMAEVQRPHETHHVMPGHDGRKAAMTRLGRMRGFGSKDGAGQAPASFRKAAMGGRALQARPEDSAERAEVEEQQVAPHGAGMPGTAIDGATEGSEGGHVDESERHHQQREEDEHHWHHWSAHFGDEDEDEDEEDWSHPMSPEERAEKLDQVEQMCRAGLPYFGIMAVFIINGLGLALHSVAAHVGRSLAEHDIMKTPAPGAQPQGQPQGQAQPAAHAPPAPPAPPSSAGSSGGSGSARPSDGTAAAAVQRDTSAADAHRSTWYQRLFAGTPSAQGYSQVGGASSGGMIEMQAQPSAVSSGGSSEQQRLNPSPYGATIGAVPMPSQSQGAGAPSSVVHSGAPAML